MAVQHRERLARMRADKDVFMEKLKEERKTVYQVSQLQGFHYFHFYCFAASTGRRGLPTVECSLTLEHHEPCEGMGTGFLPQHF